MNSHSVRERLTLTTVEMKNFLKVEHDNENEFIDLLISTGKEQADLYLNNEFTRTEDGVEIIEDIPFTVKLAVMKMVSSWYENRTDDKVNESSVDYTYSLGEIPWSSLKLLQPYKKMVGI